MNYAFHPEALTEYAIEVAYYKSLNTELGIRFHKTIQTTLVKICDFPSLYRVEYQPNIRRAKVQGFPYILFFREVEGNIQVLAIAQQRRRPLYWLNRC
jgi:toxin ParE1/3/4